MVYMDALFEQTLIFYREVRSAVQSQKAVSAYFTGKQLLHFAYADICESLQLCYYIRKHRIPNQCFYNLGPSSKSPVRY